MISSLSNIDANERKPVRTLRYHMLWHYIGKASLEYSGGRNGIGFLLVGHTVSLGKPT